MYQENSIIEWHRECFGAHCRADNRTSNSLQHTKSIPVEYCRQSTSSNWDFPLCSFIIRSRNQIDCEEATGVVLQWEIFRNKQEARNETRTSSLIIQSNVLDYGTYCIKLKLLLIMTNAYGIYGAAEGYLKIVTSDLIIVMQEGSANIRMLSQPITINAASSKDPDTTDQSGLEFSWYCYYVSDRWLEFNETEYPAECP